MKTKWDYVYTGICMAYIALVLFEALSMVGTRSEAKVFEWGGMVNFLVFLAVWAIASIQIYKFFKEG